MTQYKLEAPRPAPRHLPGIFNIPPTHQELIASTAQEDQAPTPVAFKPMMEPALTGLGA